MPKKEYFQYLFYVFFVLCFIFLIFIFLINTYILPIDFQIPILIFFGFSIIIITTFYILLNFDDTNIFSDFTVKTINENSLKFILIVLMIFTYIIPPIYDSKTILDWNQIGISNIIRAIVFIIGCGFLPGANIYKIFFPRITLHKKIGVEKFFFKICIYPLLSFTFLGVCTLILDKFGVKRDLFSPILLVIIIILYLLEYFIQKKRIKDDNSSKNKITIKNSKISKSTVIILIISIAIVLITFDISLSALYLIRGDSYRGISYANNIGLSDDYMGSYSYAFYWSYISFSLSVLAGIPYINVNALLFPFIYLFVTSIYILMKTLFKGFKNIYPILSTIFVITFSDLFYFNANMQDDHISWFIFDGIFNFRYKSFAVDLLIMGFAIFVALMKNSKNFKKNKTESSRILLVSSWFLVNSFIIYIPTVIAAFSFIFIFFITSKKNKQQYKIMNLVLIYFIVFFILLDILTNFLVSWIPSTNLFLFLDVIRPIKDYYLILNAVIIYLILIVLVIILYFCMKSNVKFKLISLIKIKNKAIIFIIILSIFSNLLVFAVFLIFGIFPYNQTYLTFYLYSLLTNVGIVGVTALYLMHLTYKKQKNLFKFLFFWSLMVLIITLFLFFYFYLTQPLPLSEDLLSEQSLLLTDWFTRNWYYLIIPLSIFFSVGIIELKNYLITSKMRNKYFFLKKNIMIVLTGMIIFLSFSNTILSGVFWFNYDHISNEEAQIMGWVSENIPFGSNILVDNYHLKNHLPDIAYSNTYLIDSEINNALDNYSDIEIIHSFDSYCDINFINELEGHQNILYFEDHNNEGNSIIQINLNSSLEYGYFNYFIRTPDDFNEFYIELVSNNNKIISILISSSSILYFNGILYQKIIDLDINKWYDCKLFFESREENYMSLSQYSWKFEINGSIYGDFNFINNYKIDQIMLYSDISSSEGSLYLDNLSISSSIDINLMSYIFSSPIIFNYLMLNDIIYLIITEGDNFYKTMADKMSIHINDLLIEKYFSTCKYEYKNLKIYAV